VISAFNFNFARQQEGDATALNIDPTARDAATPQVDANAAVVQCRTPGIAACQRTTLTALLSQIDLNHSKGKWHSTTGLALNS